MNSHKLSANPAHRFADVTELCVRLVGSPFVECSFDTFSDDELLAAYEHAFPNRVALLYLTIHRRPGWLSELEERYQHLASRERMTHSVIARIAQVLEPFEPNDYVVFKSLKPYPATPNDTDVLFLGPKARYESAYQHLLDSGYRFHEWAPQQRTLYDPRGEGKIGVGKKGGTYYIDFYEEISTDYYAYANKHRLRPYIVRGIVDGVEVNLLRPEPELAIVLFHNVFPERTFQLEHFYLPLYYLARPDFDTALFTRFVRENKMTVAVRTNLTLVQHLHRRYFGSSPDIVDRILRELGPNEAELKRFVARGEITPYMFSSATFWRAFSEKSLEWYSMRSLGTQATKMLNPVFFWDVVQTLRKRFSERGTYHLE
jgi:hypothetical protein